MVSTQMPTFLYHAKELGDGMQDFIEHKLAEAMNIVTFNDKVR